MRSPFPRFCRRKSCSSDRPRYGAFATLVVTGFRQRQPRNDHQMLPTACHQSEWVPIACCDWAGAMHVDYNKRRLIHTIFRQTNDQTDPRMPEITLLLFPSPNSSMRRALYSSMQPYMALCQVPGGAGPRRCHPSCMHAVQCSNSLSRLLS